VLSSLLNQKRKEKEAQTKYLSDWLQRVTMKQATQR